MLSTSCSAGNCVGAANRRWFIVFLYWTLVACGYASAGTLQLLWQHCVPASQPVGVVQCGTTNVRLLSAGLHTAALPACSCENDGINTFQRHNNQID